MAMRRVRNWDVQLALWARELPGQPFTWGETDCASLVLRGLAIIYPDGSPLEDIAGWSSLREAMTVARELPGGVEAVLSDAGAEPFHHLLAQSGDVVVARGSDDDGLPQLGLVVGPHVLTSGREKGLRLTSRTALDETVTLWRFPNVG